MSLTSILVHLDGGKSDETRLAAAASLAAAHGAHLIGLHVAAPFTMIAGPYGEGAAVTLTRLEQEYAEAVEARKTRVEQAFREGAQQRCQSIEWRFEDGDVAELVPLNARYADLAVVGVDNPADFAPAARGSFAGRVALAAGRPILAIPEAGVPEEIGRRVTVAWNGSREAARAARDAVPLLRRAARVMLLAVDADVEIKADEKRVLAYLARHAVDAEAHESVSRGITVEDLLLSRAADFGTDLLVMGAYGHSRLRELVFGGATRHVLAHATMPVLLSH